MLNIFVVASNVHFHSLLVFKVKMFISNYHLLRQKSSFNEKRKKKYFNLINLYFLCFVEYERHPAKIDETIAPKAMWLQTQ